MSNELQDASDAGVPSGAAECSGEAAAIPGARTSFASEATLLLFVYLFSAGLVMLAFAYATVFRESDKNELGQRWAVRERAEITYWLEHGYFSVAGLQVPNGFESKVIYRSSNGTLLLTGFLVERVWTRITGHPNWRLLQFHNALFSLLTAALFGLLAFRLARRFDLEWLHAFALGISVEAVFFTFPDNLMTFWEMQHRMGFLLSACVFLLIEERRSARDSRGRVIAQACASFFLVSFEFVAGLTFISSYWMLVLFFDRRRSLKLVLIPTVVPLLLAAGVYASQLRIAAWLQPRMAIAGSDFIFRTGFDGSMQYYHEHLDIAYGRNVARANFNADARAWLFHWPWLFWAGAAALLVTVVQAMRGRVPRTAVAAVLVLLGSYVIYGAVFSQAVVIHPYYYDVMLFTPLVVALFVIVPSLIESAVRQRGLAVIATVFLALWVSMAQMRTFAITFPLPTKGLGFGERARAAVQSPVAEPRK